MRPTWILCVDHLFDSSHEEADKLVTAIQALILSDWWLSIPTYENLEPVSGEIPWR